MAIVKRALPAVPERGKKRASAPVEQVSGFSLPTEPSTPADDMGAYSWLIFGEKKIGKTTLASMFDNALFLMTEPGAKALSVYQVAVPNWITAREALRALKSDTQFSTVVVDTVDLAFKMCEKHVCQKMAIDHPSDEDWGRGWSAVRDEFAQWVQQLMLLDKGVVFISHATEREVKTRSGQKYDRIQPTMANQARDIIEGMVDIWAYYTYEGSQRVLIIRGDEHVSAGHRLQKNFRYNGAELTKVDMGTSPNEAFSNLVKAFNNTYVPKMSEESSEPISTIPPKKLRRVR